MKIRFLPILAHVLAIIAVLPLLWIVISALKPAEDVFNFGWPSTWTLDNLQYVLLKIPLPRFMMNSAIVAVVVTVVALFFHSMAAYALARLRFPGRGIIFSGMMSTLLVSLPVILVPLFLVAKQLGLLDSYAGLIVPSIFHAFGIFLLRQYYLNIPRELEEDGKGFSLDQDFADIAVSEITGSPGNLSGATISRGDQVGSIWSGAGYSRKPTGMVCVGDTMYLAVQDLALDFNDVPAATILKSTDHGRTWTWGKRKPMFSDHVFTTIWFADFGRGGALAPDGCVYAYGLDGNWRDSFDDTVADPQSVFSRTVRTRRT
ncbi:hypothetical protein AB0E63_28500 [Kribbella sp. NPDC026596]|uniref:hypothetical protein n=1 Tax=Kribbella sp. NPDC026596 TaxID=3155122 RepID=UPI0033DB1A1E